MLEKFNTICSGSGSEQVWKSSQLSTSKFIARLGTIIPFWYYFLILKNTLEQWLIEPKNETKLDMSESWKFQNRMKILSFQILYILLSNIW